MVELVDHVENLLGEFLIAQPGDQAAAGQQMKGSALVDGNKRIGRFLNAVVQERVVCVEP